MKLMENMIQEFIYSQVDNEENHQQLIHEIVEHKKNKSAIRKSDRFTRIRDGNMVSKMTTRGWYLLMDCKDGLSDWIDMKDLKCPTQLNQRNTKLATRLMMIQYSTGG